MAEIKIEKKRPVWPWILVVLIIVGVIAYYYINSPQAEILDDPSNPNTETIENSGTQN